MHELSVALSLVDAACEKAGALGDVRVDAVYVRLGALSGVVKDALSFCFEAAAKGTAVEGARLEIEDVPVTVLCPRCAVERRLASVQHLRCPDLRRAHPRRGRRSRAGAGRSGGHRSCPALLTSAKAF